MNTATWPLGGREEGEYYHMVWGGREEVNTATWSHGLWGGGGGGGREEGEYCHMAS